MRRFVKKKLKTVKFLQIGNFIVYSLNSFSGAIAIMHLCLNNSSTVDSLANI